MKTKIVGFIAIFAAVLAAIANFLTLGDIGLRPHSELTVFLKNSTVPLATFAVITVVIYVTGLARSGLLRRLLIVTSILILLAAGSLFLSRAENVRSIELATNQFHQQRASISDSLIEIGSTSLDKKSTLQSYIKDPKTGFKLLAAFPARSRYDYSFTGLDGTELIASATFENQRLSVTVFDKSALKNLQ